MAGEAAIVGVAPVAPRHYTEAEWAEHVRKRNERVAAENAAMAKKAAAIRAKWLPATRRVSTPKPKKRRRRREREIFSAQQRRSRWVLLVERAVCELPDEALESWPLALELLKRWPELGALMETLPRQGRQSTPVVDGIIEAVCERREYSLRREEHSTPHAPPPDICEIWPITPRFQSRNGCRWVGARRFLEEWKNCVDWGSAPDDDFVPED